MNIMISNTSKEPIYEQIKRQIRLHILKGELKEDELLPSIRQLAKDLRVSVITTKKAYEQLEREGYIVSTVGRGSFVARNTLAFLKEKQFHLIEEKLRDVIEESKGLNMSLTELKEMMELLYLEGHR